MPTLDPQYPADKRQDALQCSYSDLSPYLPKGASTIQNGRRPTVTRRVFAGVLSLALSTLFICIFWPTVNYATSDHAVRGLDPFFSSIKSHTNSSLCPGMYATNGAVSYSGYIGLKGDTESEPRRAFFWFFEAQSGSADAPTIFAVGGGPGTSGMLNPLLGQSHCRITENGIVANPNAWTENFNLIALDYPIGVGFSYGRIVNNSRDAALDAYDFLQKFYTLFPKLVNNPLVLASGSYGGTYIPHIATVIHEQNVALAETAHGKQRRTNPGAQHIKLESMMISNPYSDMLHHYRWALHQRCYLTDLFNASQCREFHEHLPACLEAVQVAYERPSREHKKFANDACAKTMVEPLDNGRAYENVRWKCDGTFEDCIPEAIWASRFFNEPANRAALGVPAHVNFSWFSQDIWEVFNEAGDLVQKPYLLYEPLLEANYRLLHYIGREDANCGWPGVLALLKIIRSRYQDDFLVSPDVPWWTSRDEYADVTTVRAIGPGAGNMTYVLMGGAGHMVVKDQPALVKRIVERWVANKEWF